METGCGCLCWNILCRQRLRASPKAFKVYRRQSGPKQVTETMLQQLLLYPRQLLNDDSDIDEKEQAQNISEAYVKAGKPIKVRKRLEMYGISEVYPFIPTFPSHVPYRLSTHFGEKELFRNTRNASETCGAENGRRDWMCTTFHRFFLLTGGLLVIFWRSWLYHIEMLDKKCSLGVWRKLERS